MAPERQVCREKVGEMLGEKVMYIAETLNRHEYVPKMPNQSELDLVFDTTFSDVQPYLYKVCRHETYFSRIFFPLCHQVHKAGSNQNHVSVSPAILSQFCDFSGIVPLPMGCAFLPGVLFRRDFPNYACFGILADGILWIVFIYENKLSELNF